MAITPQSFNKLAKNNSGPSSSGVVTSYDGLTAGDKAFILGSIETLINSAIGGSQKMGGSTGLIDKLDQKLGQFSESVKKEVVDMFRTIMSKISDAEKKADDEPCKIDEKEYKKLNQESLQETFDGKVGDRLAKKITVKQKTSLGTKFINAVLKDKHVQGVLTGIKQTGSFIMQSVSGLFTTFFPNFSKFITESLTFMKTTTKFMFFIGKFVYHAIAMIASLIMRTTLALGLALARFIFLVAYIAAQTVFIIGSILFQLAVFFAPVVITIGLIALKLLFLVGIVLLALFIIFSFYHFIKTWIDKGFGVAISELFGGETFRKALEGVFATLETLFGMQPGTLATALNMLTSGELYTSITNWIGEKWIEFKDWMTSGIKNLLVDIGTSILNKITSFWDNTLKPFIQPVIDGVDYIWTLVKSGWEWLKTLPVIGPVLTWMQDVFVKGWATLYGWVEAIYKTTVGAIADVTTAVLDPSLAGQMAEIDVTNQHANLVQSTALKEAMKMVMGRKGYSPEQITRMWRLPGGNGQDISNLVKLNHAIQASSDILAFSKGGIALGPILAAIGEAGDNEAVIPLNAQGAQFLADAMSNLNVSVRSIPIDAKSSDMIKDMLSEEMEIGNSSQNSNVNQIDSKLDAIIKLGGISNGNNTSVNVSNDGTSDYIDMIAKGMLE